MNLLWSRKLLILLLISIISIISCKRGNDDISGTIQPKVESLTTHYQDTFKLSSSIVIYDSIRTDNTFRLLVGQYQDHEFGKTTCNAFTAMYIDKAIKSFGPNPAVDSVYIKIQYGNKSSTTPNTPTSAYIYGTDKSPQRFSIHLIDPSKTITTDPYYKSSSINFEPIPLITFSANGDSTQIIPINKQIGEKFIIENPSKFSAQADFQNFFKGLAIISDPSNTVVRGIEAIEIVIAFHNYYGLNNLRVNELYTIKSTFAFNGTKAFNNITTDRTGSKIDGEISTLHGSKGVVSGTQPTDKCYIQSNTGIFTKIQFPSIEAFKSRIKGKILINKVDLIIKPAQEDRLNFNFPSYLFAYELTEAGNVKKSVGNSSINQILQDEEGGIFGNFSPYYAGYDEENKQYKFTITSYFQALIDGNKNNDGIILGGANQFISSQNSAAILDRITFYNDRKKPYNISLRVYYTPY